MTPPYLGLAAKFSAVYSEWRRNLAASGAEAEEFQAESLAKSGDFPAASVAWALPNL